MIVVVCLEQRFAQTPDGRLWTQVAFPYSFWQRYLEVFDGVRIVARVCPAPTLSSKFIPADGPGVTVAAVPNYHGPWQYALHARQVRRIVRNAVGPQDAVIMRIPSQLGNCLGSLLIREARPYAVEVVADPWDTFAPGVIHHPLSPFFRHYFTRQTRRQCLHACGAAYVTERTLQQRYPVQPGGLSTFYSSVQLPKRAAPPSSEGSTAAPSANAFLARTAQANHAAGPIQLVMVGSLAQLYKGPDVALHALAKCRQRGLDISLTIVGDGMFRESLEQQAARLGLTQSVVFRGQLTQGAAVQAELDRADLFIMPSRTEGLPRAMLEAMARGLPCIGSAVGGIPELLPPEDLVPPGDAGALATRIHEIVTNPTRMQQMSSRNLKRSQDFTEDVLHGRRLTFYRFVREQTAAWLRNTVRSAAAGPHIAPSTHTPFCETRRKSA